MKSIAVERKRFVCLAALLATSVPMIFTACGGGIVAPVSSQSSPLRVVSVVPDYGLPTGGMVVLINGSNFTSRTKTTSLSVSFGGTPASRVRIISPVQLSVVVPAHSNGTVSVKVTTSDGSSSELAGAFTYTNSSSSIKSISPISGPAAGGTQITISGSNFQPGASVSIGGYDATSVNVGSSTMIQAITPAHSPGSASVIVTNPDGQSETLSSGFTFHGIDLMWAAPSSTSSTIVGYNVYRATLSGGPFGRLNGLTPVGSTSFTDPSVQGSTTYYYEVKSVDSKGAESLPAGPVQATTGP